MDSEQIKVEHPVGKLLARELRRRCNTKWLVSQDAWYEAANELENFADSIIASHAPVLSPAQGGRTLDGMWKPMPWRELVECLQAWEPMPCGHQNMFLYAIPGAPAGLQCALCRIKELEARAPAPAPAPLTTAIEALRQSVLDDARPMTNRQHDALVKLDAALRASARASTPAPAPNYDGDFWHDQFLKLWREICEAAGNPTDPADPNYVGVDKFVAWLKLRASAPTPVEYRASTEKELRKALREGAAAIQELDLESDYYIDGDKHLHIKQRLKEFLTTAESVLSRVAQPKPVPVTSEEEDEKEFEAW